MAKYWTIVHVSMGNSVARKTLSVVLAGIVLAGSFSVLSAGMLLCIGDGTDPDCCRNTEIAGQSRLGQSRPLLDRADCHCCVTMDAVLSTPGASPDKASLYAAAGPPHSRSVALPLQTRASRINNGAASHERLSSLRTIVLLV